jgi:hypothetical protein
MKWKYYFGAALIAIILLLWNGAPLAPVLAGIAIVGLLRLTALRA